MIRPKKKFAASPTYASLVSNDYNEQMASQRSSLEDMNFDFNTNTQSQVLQKYFDQK